MLTAATSISKPWEDKPQEKGILLNIAEKKYENELSPLWMKKGPHTNPDKLREALQTQRPKVPTGDGQNAQVLNWKWAVVGSSHVLGL